MNKRENAISKFNKKSQFPKENKKNSKNLIYKDVIYLFTDGSCRGNPGRGGVGIVILEKFNRIEISEGYKYTTNNRMELLSIIKGLRRILPKKDCIIKVTTDSRYIVNAINYKWLQNWKKNGWIASDKNPVKNIDLWKEIDKLIQENNVGFSWVRGHSGHPENERCDQLAREACSNDDLLEDIKVF